MTEKKPEENQESNDLVSLRDRFETEFKSEHEKLEKFARHQQSDWKYWTDKMERTKGDQCTYNDAFLTRGLNANFILERNDYVTSVGAIWAVFEALVNLEAEVNHLKKELSKSSITKTRTDMTSLDEKLKEAKQTIDKHIAKRLTDLLTDKGHEAMYGSGNE